MITRAEVEPRKPMNVALYPKEEPLERYIH